MRARQVVSFGCFVAALACLSGVSGRGRQADHVFRAATDIVILDVSVLDKQRRAVRGLTAADFEVLIDGRAHPVATFEEIRSPDVARAALQASASGGGAIDISTNYSPDTRLVVLVVDDYSLAETRADPGQVDMARKVALEALDALAPSDLAAVVFTASRFLSEGFTHDRALLRRTVEQLVVVPDPPVKVEGTTAGDQGYCDCGVCSIDVLKHVADAMAGTSDRRKTVVYISAGPVVTVPRSLIPPTSTDPPLGATRQEHCAWQRLRAMDSALRSAQQAHVRIDAIDPLGIQLGRHAAKSGTTELVARPGTQANPVFEILDDPALARQEALRAVADATGGRAVVNNNEPNGQMRTLLMEGASYYLLGVQRPSGSPGPFHRVRVRVGRPGLQVSTRNGYYDAHASDRPAGSRLLEDALAGPLPSVGFPLRLATSVVRTGGDPVLSFVLGVDENGTTPHDVPSAIEIGVNLLDSETTNVRASRRLHVSLDAARRQAAFEVLSTLRVPPGRYELRVGALRGQNTASVFTTVEIPDFNGPLALSGPVLVAPPEPLIDQESRDVPWLERFTSRRRFQRTEDVLAVLRIYHHESDRTLIGVRSRVLDADERVVATDTEDIVRERADAPTPAEYRVALPLAAAVPGEYVLVVDVRAGENTQSRRLQFRVE